jgi:hypothetical protein
MADESERIAELEGEVVRLMEEVDRFRTATEDSLQQLDWCIGYFVGSNKTALARALGANRASIRGQIRRPSQQVPTHPTSEEQAS